MRVTIFGASGTGVTTTGEHLAASLKVPYFDTDTYFWKKTDPPFVFRQDPTERNQIIRSELLRNKHWILGGSVINWGANVFPAFDLIIFLYVPTAIRIERLKRRELQRYGDAIHTNPTSKERFEKFIGWAADYDNNSGIANRTLAAHENWLTNVRAPILRLSGDLTTAERISMILEKLRKEGLRAETL